ncbi:MAG: hypothetical protein N2C13_05745 [Chloroflexota bacterium]
MTTQTNNSRMGMHYFPDSDHYRKDDLNTWLPKLEALGARWLTLIAPINRAIPEHFLQGLIQAGIEPVLQFSCRPDAPAPIDELEVLLKSYADWGVKYVSLFEAPNIKDNWSSSSWVQSDLVNRFVDVFVPLAQLTLKFGLTPVFPALVPGGDYWDSAFLRSALQIMNRDGENALLDKLVLGMHAWAGDASLSWGSGGPERWPGARPYFTPANEQDQLGLRIFDWYAASSEAALGRKLPMMIMSAGSVEGKGKFRQVESLTPDEHATRNLQIAKMMSGDFNSIESDQPIDAIPSEVLCCNFWLLAHDGCCPDAKTAWFEQDGQPRDMARKVIEWQRNRPAKVLTSAHVENGVEYMEESDELSEELNGVIASKQSTNEEAMTEINEEIIAEQAAENIIQAHSPAGQLISHYLLLPIYDWGVADWHLDVIRPFVKKYRPTVGYSVEEASQAKRVTVIGGKKYFPSETIEALKARATNVEQIVGDGTVIASQLENL